MAVAEGEQHTVTRGLCGVSSDHQSQGGGARQGLVTSTALPAYSRVWAAGEGLSWDEQCEQATSDLSG